MADEKAPAAAGGTSRLITLAVLLSGITVALFAVALTLGLVALNARMHPQAKPKVYAPLPGPTYLLTDQVYNLAEPGRFLKATLVLEMDNEGKSEKQMAALMEEVKKRDPQLRDIVIRTINGRTFGEVNSPQGKTALKDELVKRINTVLASGELKHVLFTTFAMQ